MFGGPVETVTEGVVMTVFLVIAHITPVLLSWLLNSGPRFLYSDVPRTVGAWEGVLTEVDGGLAVASAAFKLSSVGGSGAAAVVAFGVVNNIPGVVGSWGMDGVEVLVVYLVTNVELSVDVTGVGFSVASVADCLSETRKYSRKTRPATGTEKLSENVCVAAPT
jgi:hypothetical protein